MLESYGSIYQHNLTRPKFQTWKSHMAYDPKLNP